MLLGAVYLLIASFYLAWRCYSVVVGWKEKQKIREELKKIKEEVNTPSRNDRVRGNCSE